MSIPLMVTIKLVFDSGFSFIFAVFIFHFTLRLCLLTFVSALPNMNNIQ